MKRISISFLLFVFIMQTVMSSILLPSSVLAIELDDNPLIDVNLLDEQGNAVNLANKITLDSKLDLKYQWSLADIDVSEGKALSFQIPSELTVTEEKQGPLVTSDNQSVGEYSITTQGIVTLHINAEEETTEAYNGLLSVPVKLNAEKIKGDEESLSIPFTLREGSKVIEVGLESIQSQEEKDSLGQEKAPETEEALKEEQPSDSGQQEKDITDLSVENERKEVNIREIKSSNIEENILVKAELTYEDENGNNLERPNKNSYIGVDYTWKLQNGHGYKDGATFTFTLPEELEVYNIVDKEEIRFNNQVIGHFSVAENGTATIVFNEFIEQYSNIEGTLKVWTKLSEELVVNEEKTVTITPIKDSNSIKIPIEYTPNGPTVTKSGLANKAYNANSISWTVDFNKSLENLENAVLSDPIQTGQELKAGSVKLFHFNTKLNGQMTLGDEVDPSLYEIGKTGDSKDFTIKFKNKIGTAYRLVYETTITDENKKKFDNKAILLSGDSQKGEAAASVSVNRGSHLEKSSTGYDADKQSISWEIKYNYNEKAIKKDQAILKDLFTNSQSLMKESLKIYNVTIDEDGKESVGEEIPASAYTLQEINEDNKNGFNLSFNNDIKTAYKIVYQTKAIDRVFEGETIKNTVISPNETKEASRNIGQRILFKSHGTPNYKDKSIDWTITFNHDQYEMNNVNLVDIFVNEGLTLDKDSLVIKSGENTLELGKDYTLAETSDAKFAIKLLYQIDHMTTIKYKTSFDYEKRQDKTHNYLENKGVLTWVDENGDEAEKEVVSRFTPDSFTQSNGFKNGNYDAITKEITWNVGINYNEKLLRNAVVEDYILGNQRLVDNSIEVFKMNLTGGSNGIGKGELVPSEDYSISYKEDEDGNKGFRIEFKEIQSAYYITYKTSLKDLALVSSKYDNKAVLYDGETKETELSASVSIPHGGTYITKDGTQSGKLIDWKVNINFAQSQIMNASIEDIPSPNQMLLKDSFHLYSTNVDSKGNVTKGEELVQGKDYSLQLEEDPSSFKLVFLKEINEPHILEYQSYIQANVNDAVSNDVSITGVNIEPGQISSTEKVVIVKRTAGMGDGTGVLAKLKVVKIDASSQEKLQGAAFSLVDKQSGITLKTAVTDDKGEILFDKLLFGDYVLKEDKAPEGYLAGINGEQNITIEKENSEITIKNQKIIKAVQLTKVDMASTDTTLAGATFKLLKKVDDKFVELETLTTDGEGKLFRDNLEPGEYQFIETKAPNGYELNEEPIAFTIKEDQTKVIELVAKNKKLGSVELMKLDKDDKQTPLANAVFQLWKDGELITSNLKTDAKGSLFVENLKPGSYQFIETTAPDYYKLDSKPIDFTIEDGKTDPVKVTAYNELVEGSVELTKVNQADSKEALEGAEFELRNEAGELIAEKLVTDKAGKITVDQLKPGKYQFIEVKAPADFQLNSEPISFTISKSKTAADAEQVKVTAANTLIPGSVKLTKVEKDDHSIVLADAVFELQDKDGNTINSDLKTDEEGKILIENLAPGTYQFIEKQAPFGYMLEKEPVIFEIERGQTEVLSIKVENELILGAVELLKVDADNDMMPLKDAEFELQDQEGNSIKSGLITNEAGKIFIDGLKPGNYQFVETKPPFGYKKVESPISFVIVKGQEKPLLKVVTNELTLGSVELTKIDADNHNLVLEGAEFELQDKEGKMLQEGLKTNEEGKIRIDGLKPGSYQLVETKAPVYYQLNEKPIIFTIEKGQERALEVTAENSLITGSVELTKLDADQQDQYLSEAEFVLQDDNGHILFEKLVTNKEGKIVVENLKPGNYQFVEVKAPKDYVLNKKPVAFTISKSETAADVKVVTVSAFNELTPGSVELTKVDADDENLVLEGAEFELQDTEGKTLQEGLKTDKDGKIYIDGLKPGKYQLVEAKAPTYYQLSKKPIVFTIERGQTKALEIAAENSLITGSVELTKVDADDKNLRLENAEFSLQDIEGNTILGNLKTNKDGKLLIEGIKPGKYQLVETKAPVYYQLNNNPIVFTIEKGQEQLLEVKAENSLITGSVELTKVDADDKNLVLEGAEFELQDTKGKVLQEGLKTDEDGKIRIEGLKPGKYQLVETKAPADYQLNGNPIVFTIEKGQTKPLEVVAENSLIPGSVEITKVDADNKNLVLEGAEFSLQDTEGKVLQEGLKTDKDGKIRIEGLKPGKYQLVETKAPAYYQLNSDPIVFTIEKGQEKQLEITAENSLITSSVELTKVDADQQEQYLTGAEFVLQDDKGNILFENLVTNESGKILVENLKPGNYQFVEVKAPKNYHLNKKPVPFTISKSSTAAEVKKVTIIATNELTPGAVELTKVDADKNDLVIGGAEFALQDMEGKNLLEGLKTDKDGKIHIDGLKPGKYQLVETKAPAYYQLNSDPLVFTIEKGQVKTLEVKAENSLIPGSVELTKVDADQQNLPLSNAEFVLKDSQGNVLIEGLVTNKAGKILVENLKPGDYQFVEVKAPKNYDLNKQPIPFTISKSKTLADVKMVPITATNELTAGAVKLTKVDTDDKNLALEGAEFELQDTEGKVLQEGLKTDEDGKIRIQGLKPGKYQLVETKAPAYYQLNSEPITFTIEKGQAKALEVVAENSLKPGSVELTKVDADNKNLVLEGAEFELQDTEGKVLQEGLKTDEDGKILIEGLKPGKYQMVETKAPAYYQLNGKPITFAIEKGQEKVLKVTAENSLITGSVELTKVDADQQDQYLSEAEFVLQDDNGNILFEKLVTNKEGKILVENLKPGNYQFVEVKAPKGYVLNKKPIAFTISKSKTAADVKVVTVSAINELTPGAVELTKVDADNKNLVLEGAEFELQDTEGKVLQEGLKTDEDGKILIEGLKPGKYQMVETKAPSYYQLNSDPIVFTIEKGQMKMLELMVTNKLMLGSAIVKKVDETTNQPLENAHFKVTDKQGNIIIEEGISGRDGSLELIDLLPGEYFLFETKAPNGYKKLLEPIMFEITKGQQEPIVVKVANEKVISEEQKPTPESDDESGTKGEDSSGSKNNPGKTLPDTATSYFNYILAGMLLIGFSVLIRIRNRGN
ncbi:SpaA isopeptide-forming pilin-related protein [Niallia circulans]|uniref:SpaA isopeptide-forming pilin-related protein n=1 Tax=Niallia circulans TaxID=1397 RepID=UPI0035231F4F